jgi:cellulose synthase/poly-beta-1,6-N-acetylglucosamine synthase-like glycosyltransferase
MSLSVLVLLQFIVCFHLLYPFILYLTGFAVKVVDVNRVPLEERDYAIIVTAYQQTELIPSVVDSILRLNYSNYNVYVISDDCDISKLSISSPRVVVLRPEAVLSSNIKSHFYAINNFVKDHEVLAIIDSDNLVHPEFLNELNSYFSLGFSAVQGVRTAKNLDSSYACLDEAGDMYYRYVDRRLLFSAGSSASLAGSGMAFTVPLYIECLQHLQLNGAGFDKLLQYEIIKRGHRIAFAEKAIIFDEKTSKTDQLVKQRARWLNTWFKFFTLGIKLNLLAVKRIDRNQFLFSLMLLRPPLFLLFMSYGVLFLVSIYFFDLDFSVGPVIAMMCFLYVFRRALRYFKANDKVYSSLRNYPRFRRGRMKYPLRPNTNSNHQYKT